MVQQLPPGFQLDPQPQLLPPGFALDQAADVSRETLPEPPNAIQRVLGDVLSIGGRAASSPAAQFSPVVGPLASVLSDTPRARAIRQGSTAGFADEITGVLAGQGAAQEARSAAQSFRETNPGQAIGLELAGGAGTFALGGGALGAAGRVIPALGRAGAAARALPATARLAGTGGATGAVFGAGFAEPGERGRRAAQGAAIGAVSSPAINKVLGGIGVAFNTLATPIRNRLNRIAQAEARRIDQLIKNAPSIDKLRAQVNTLFEQAKREGVTATPRQTAILSKSLDGMLKRESVITPKGQLLPDFPNVNRARVLISDFADEAMTPAQMQNVRQTIQTAAQSKNPQEARIGTMMLKRFDSFIDNSAPLFRQARPIFQRLKKAELLDEATELAGARAGQFSGSGFENALRTEFRRLDRDLVKGRLKGFTQAEIQAIRSVARGTPASNTARLAGKFAPTGAVSAGVSGGVPFLVGNAIGGPPVGAALSVGMIGTGIGGRALATRLGIEAVNTANALVRSGLSPAVVQKLTVPQQEMISLLLAGQLAKQNDTEQQEGEQ